MTQKRIYIAGPLFSDGEREFNEKVNGFLLENGFSTFLPQKDGYELSKLVQETHPADASALIFSYDVEQIKRSDILVFIMDGRVPDEGACVEVGIAYTLGKECFGLKTDSRSLLHSQDNPMILGVLKGRVAHSCESLLAMIREYSGIDE